MGLDAPPLRKPEVTRTVRLSRPDAIRRPHSVTPYQKQNGTWNGPIYELFGYDLTDVRGTEDWWLDRIHPDDHDRILESLAQHLIPAPDKPFAAESRIWGPDYRFRCADGTYLLISDRTIITRDKHGNAVETESVVFDKEKRHRDREAHAKLLESQNHLALVAMNTPSAIFMMDPQVSTGHLRANPTTYENAVTNTGFEGYCIFMNNSAEETTGFKFHEISDYTFHASVHSCRPNGDNYPLHECPVFGHQRAGQAAKNEPEIFVHKDGHFYDIEFSVSPIGTYSSGGAIIEFRDVTEQKRIERERLNAVLLTEQQSVRIKADDVHKENMTSFVSFVCHELRNPLQGVTSSAEFLLDTLQKLDALTSKLSVVTNGTTVQQPLENASEQLTLSSASEDKITDIIRPSPSRNRNSGAIDRNALVGMESLIAYAKQLVGNIQQCSEHQALITNNVLDLSRLDANKVEPAFEVVDMQALGQQTVGMMAAKAQRKSINLSLKEDGSWPLYLKADPTILRQVLLNLVSNAIKFTHEHGTITIGLYADPPNDAGRVTLHGSVTDNGLGMSNLEQQRLFQRFSQANRRVAQLYGGSGLGLSISKELVRVLGGEMHVESAQGKGSTFSFTSLHDPPTKDELIKFLRQSNSLKDGLPVASDSDVSAASSSRTSSDTPPPQFKLVVVGEDNPINLQLLARHLKMLGYKTILCTNGKEVLDKVCEPGSTIDCCILDMSMPVMDGLESAHLIREFEARKGVSSRNRLPIIALSGNAMTEQVSDALAVGISDYLIKPCKQAQLSRTLKHWERVVHTGAEHLPGQA